MDNATLNQNALAAALDDAVVVWREEMMPGTPPARGQIRLFNNDINPVPTTGIADFIEPADMWYVPANHPAEFGETFEMDAGYLGVACPGTIYNWTAAGGAGPETIYGYFVTDMAGTDWICAKRLPQPVTLSNLLSSLPIDTFVVAFPPINP